MSKDGSILSIDTGQLVNSVFALLPIPVAVVDDEGKIVLANSSFADLFPDTRKMPEHDIHERVVPERGTFDFETLPLNDHGFRIVYGTDISKEVCLRRQLTDTTALDRLRNNAEPVPAACELNEIVRSVVRLRAPFIRAENIVVSLVLDPELPPVLANLETVTNVLTALMINAERAIVMDGRHCGSISIRTWLGHKGVRLSIGDNGAGIIARRLSAVGQGEPFNGQTDPVHPASVGWCADLLKKYGGELFCWSSYAVGSTYTMELCVAPPDASPPQQSDF